VSLAARSFSDPFPACLLEFVLTLVHAGRVILPGGLPPDGLPQLQTSQFGRCGKSPAEAGQVAAIPLGSHLPLLLVVLAVPFAVDALDRSLNFLLSMTVARSQGAGFAGHAPPTRAHH
jgi:hypothetical protein